MCAYSRSTRVEIHHLTGVERYGASVRHGWRRGKNPVLILLGLGVLWAAVLGPQVVRHRHRLGRPVVALVAAGRIDGRRLRSVRRAATSVPGNVGSARRRRRDLLLAMAGIAVFTFLGGVAVGGAVWVVHFLVDVVLVVYAVLVAQRHQLEAERAATVVPFRSAGPLVVGHSGSVAMRDEAVLSRQAN